MINKFKEIDDYVYMWLNDALAKQEKVSVYANGKYPQFRTSNGWLHKFLKWHNVVSPKIKTTPKNEQKQDAELNQKGEEPRFVYYYAQNIGSST